MTEYNVTIQDGNNKVVIQTEGPQGPAGQGVTDNTITFEGTGPAKIVYDDDYKTMNFYIDDDLPMYIGQEGMNVTSDMFNVEAMQGVNIAAFEYLELYSADVLSAWADSIQLLSDNGRLTINGVVHAVGEGSPEGVVEGPVGSKYVEIKPNNVDNVEWTKVKAVATGSPGGDWVFETWDNVGWKPVVVEAPKTIVLDGYQDNWEVGYPDAPDDSVLVDFYWRDVSKRVDGYWESMGSLDGPVVPKVNIYEYAEQLAPNYQDTHTVQFAKNPGKNPTAPGPLPIMFYGIPFDTFCGYITTDVDAQASDPKRFVQRAVYTGTTYKGPLRQAIRFGTRPYDTPYALITWGPWQGYANDDTV